MIYRSGLVDESGLWGGGRKKTEIINPELLDALDTLIEPETRGYPESPLRWTTKSTRHLADALTAMGHRVSHSVVAKILGSLGKCLRCRVQSARHSQDLGRKTASPP